MAPKAAAAAKFLYFSSFFIIVKLFESKNSVQTRACVLLLYGKQHSTNPS